jgi:hypothetical protein
MLAERLADHDDAPVGDHIVRLRDATWSDYQRALEMRGGRPAHPHLAIEVIWTSGGLDKREICQALGVRELWFWRRGRIHAFALRGDHYEEIVGSEVLPGIELTQLVTFLDRETASQAIREYRAALQSPGYPSATAPR